MYYQLYNLSYSFLVKKTLNYLSIGTIVNKYDKCNSENPAELIAPNVPWL